MNADIKARWVAALRSGQYRQGVNALRDAQNRYCCLGVLCDLIDPDKWRDHYDDEGYRQDYAFAGQQGFPPAELLEDIGLDEELSNELAATNDSGVTFSRIADIIEERA